MLTIFVCLHSNKQRPLPFADYTHQQEIIADENKGAEKRQKKSSPLCRTTIKRHFCISAQRHAIVSAHSDSFNVAFKKTFASTNRTVGVGFGNAAFKTIRLQRNIVPYLAMKFKYNLKYNFATNFAPEMV